ncbi:alpha/beta hydrolase family protein [Alteromonas halophila]|uniref:Acetylhydrolase n=1 Tax=Alteromonas halophila TaxID=516698 RepID=A0A918MWH0_9ALTE|nr:acetylhydrolase [Alteromonas halophila]GGW81047.1 hypothetical protein GCM10007391_12690 [Alteromonas halophila]
MKVAKFLALSAWVIAGTSAAGQQQGQALYKPFPEDVTPELSAPGEYAVGVKTMTVTIPDQPQDLSGERGPRGLTLEVWYPATERGAATTYEDQTRSGKTFVIQADATRDAPVAASDTPYPLVVLSHGYTGYRTIMYYLGEHLASHGYVVAGIDHSGSTNADVDMKNAPYAGFPNTLLNRSRDQLHTLQALNADETFGKAIDASAAGLIGYSMGGYGAVNTVGGCYDFGEGAVKRLTGADNADAIGALQSQLNTCAGGQSDVDPRWKAMMALAPWGGQLRVFDPAELAAIAVPTLYVAGEFDDISGYDGVRWLFENTTGAPGYLLTIHNARHNIAAHPAPAEAMGTELDLGHYLEPAWRTQSLNAINEHFALALMNCYVKNINADCDYLKVRGSSAQVPANGETPPPWKGFDNRFALGLSMEANDSADAQ